jgi:hypothetical protein
MPSRASAKFMESRILDKEDVSEADARAFHFLLSVLQKHEYVASKTRTQLNKIIPGFDLFAWQVEERRINAPNGLSITGHDVVHQGIHVAISARFGHKLKGRPLMTLLNEAIGLGLELYLAVSYLNCHSLETPSNASTKLFVFLNNSEHLGIPVIRKLNDALKNPYKAFVRVAEDVFKVHYEIYSNLANNIRGPKNTPIWCNITKAIKANPYYVFAHDYTLAVPALNLAAYCGLDTNEEDLTFVNECLTLLRKSESLNEFLQFVSEPSKQNLLTSLVNPRPQILRFLCKTNKSVAKRQRPIESLNISDETGLRNSDAGVYDFLLEYVQSAGVAIDKYKSKILSRNGVPLEIGMQFNRLDWFLIHPAFHFDLPQSKVSARNFLSVSAGFYAFNKLKLRGSSLPLTMLLVFELSSQFLKYMERIKSPTNKITLSKQKKALANFKRGLLKGLARRRLIFDVCVVKAQGRAIDDEKILRLVRAHRPLADWRGTDFTTSILAAGAFCGFKSSEEDLLLVSKCIDSILHAKSMMDCLLRIATCASDLDKFQQVV